jgi:hypothetical protein
MSDERCDTLLMVKHPHACEIRPPSNRMAKRVM